MIIEILFVVDLFLWLLTLLPAAPVQQFGWASSWLAFIGVLLLGLFLFLPALRG